MDSFKPHVKALAVAILVALSTSNFALAAESDNEAADKATESSKGDAGKDSGRTADTGKGDVGQGGMAAESGHSNDGGHPTVSLEAHASNDSAGKGTAGGGVSLSVGNADHGGNFTATVSGDTAKGGSQAGQVTFTKTLP